MSTLQELSEAIQKGNAPKAKEITSALLAAKVAAGEVRTLGAAAVAERHEAAHVGAVNLEPIVFFVHSRPSLAGSAPGGYRGP